MVAHGPALSLGLKESWDSLDVDGPSSVAWIRPVEGRRVVLLLGAFDPPTLAHVSIASSASRAEGVPAALCLTKVALARPDDDLMPPVSRLGLLDKVASSRRFGLAVANRGTYLDVHRTLSAEGFDATFVIGSDKLEQLEDPSFYPDGDAGARSTFSEVRFVVVPRGATVVERDDVRILEVEEVFDDPGLAVVSSTEVRRRIRAGEGFEALVPSEVAVDLAGYTSAK
jgi:nicotinic acid mononucleotide adenylyltransferase